MECITKSNDAHKSGKAGRRSFLKKLTLAVGSSAILPVFGKAGKFEPTQNNEIVTQLINYPAPKMDIRAFMAHPNREGRFPAVVVIHENRGLQPHIKDVAERFAREGFLAMAPDALTPVGGTPDNDAARAAELIRSLDNDDTVDNLVAAVKYLKTHPRSTGKVGCTGFSWGGAMTGQVAVHSPELDAAVSEDPPAFDGKSRLHRFFMGRSNDRSCGGTLART